MKNDISLIIPFRNRSVDRLQRSLNSLSIQTNLKFPVILIDYGSSTEVSQEIKKLIANYNFVKYYFQDTSILPWSRAHALNIGVKECKTAYFFPIDVDLIFKKNFIEILYQCMEPHQIISFRVAFLKKNNTEWKSPEKMKIESISPSSALGMTLFKKTDFLEIGGYNEKFVYWGGEDNDIVVRFKKKGYKHMFYSGDELLYHQWHPRYEMQQETFPKGIKSFLLESNIQNIFQQNRKVGEVLAYKKADFLNFKLSARKFYMTWEIEQLFQTKTNSLICFSIGPTKRKLRFTKGKQYFVFKAFNKIFRKRNLNISWIYDEGLYRNYEVRDQIIKYAISKRRTFDLVGMEVLEEKVNVYIKKY